MVHSVQVMVDKGGESGQSTKFLQILIDHHISLDTKGAYALFKNRDEHQHRTLTTLIKNLLYIGNLLNEHWCFELHYSVFLLCKFVNYTNITNKSPYEIWHDRVLISTKTFVWINVVYL